MTDSRPLILIVLAALASMAALLVWLNGSNTGLFLTLNQAGAQLPDALWTNLTLVADTLFAIAVLLIAGSYRPQMLNQALVLLLLGTLVVHGFKNGLDVLRPAGVLDRDSFRIIGQVLKSHSFPSGHSFTALSCAGLLFLNLNNRLTGGAVLLLGALAALSRIMVGAHWPLDVLVGGAAGLLLAVISVALVSRIAWLQANGLKFFTAILLTLASAALSVHQDGYPHTDALAVGMSLLALGIAMQRIWRPFVRLCAEAFRR
ncbi:phosphatase PAP2 family protein [Thalassolituus sp. LLYu03]|uniref:phosphatase PAP2 family protein n=1 Tax=Thalassolituus sp. LLYu03 TaxID=3421656 RepID=UPI003D28FD57